MPKVIAAQTNFAAGQITPRLHGQPDVKGYQQGLAEMTNFYPLAHGPCRFRNGSITQSDIPGTFGVLKSMQIRATEGYIITLSNDGNLYLSDAAGPVHATELIQCNDFNCSTGWTDVSLLTGVATIASGQLQLSPGSHPTQDHSAGIRQTVAITGTANEHHFHWVSSSDQLGNTFRLMIGTTPGGTEIHDGDYTSANGQFDFTPGAATIYIELRAYTDDPDRTFTQVTLHDAVTTAHTAFAHPWDADIKLLQVQTAQPPGGYQMYFVQRDHPPYVLTHNAISHAWTFTTVSFTSPPAEWVAGNYPGAITFFQGRMWLAGTNDEPEQMWGSKSGDYTNFTTGSLADDALDLPLDKAGEIVWLVGARNLLVGTVNSENILVSEGAVLKPGDASVEEQSKYGSERVQPIQIGNKILYLTADGMKIRDMGFEWTKDSWSSRDLMWIAEDLGKNSRLLRGTWVQTPESLLIFLRQNGTALIGQYDDDLDLYGWSVANSPCERICDINSLTTFGLPTLFVLSLLNPGDTSMILQYEPPGAGDVFMDFTEILTPQPPATQVTQITGLTRLANKTVGVVVDGAIHPDRTLDSNGDDPDPLQFAADEFVYVGLKYEGQITTLPPVTGLQGGTDRTFIKHHARIFLDLLDSSVPIIQGDRPPTRHPVTPMGQREPFQTGLIHVGDLGNDRDAQVTIVQDLPLKCVIRGIYMEKTTAST